MCDEATCLSPEESLHRLFRVGVLSNHIFCGPSEMNGEEAFHSFLPRLPSQKYYCDREECIADTLAPRDIRNE